MDSDTCLGKLLAEACTSGVLIFSALIFYVLKLCCTVREMVGYAICANGGLWELARALNSILKGNGPSSGGEGARG